MKRLGWIIGVAVVVAIAFFIPEQKGEIWTSVFSAMSVVSLLFIGLLYYVYKKGGSTADKSIGVGLIMLLAALSVFNGYNQYRASVFQAETLPKIRKTIERGIVLSHTYQPMLKTLRKYHQSGNGEMSLEKRFKERHEEKIRPMNGQLRYIPNPQKDSAESPYLYYVKTATPDTVVLVGQSMQVPGKNTAFTNYNGQTGLLQYRATLTKGGVDYVREN